MTRSKQGENLAREWSEDPQAPEVWDALQLIRLDPSAGIKNLKDLAERGSAIAMIHLGHIYLDGQFGVERDHKIGEDFLKCSVDMGSIEGEYRLAKHFGVSGRGGEAINLYRNLADRGYIPAIFALGFEYYLGNIVENDLDKSLFYFKQADAAGHLHATHWVSYFLMKDRQTLFSWLRGFWKKLRLFIPMMNLSINYPNSDRLRR